MGKPPSSGPCCYRNRHGRCTVAAEVSRAGSVFPFCREHRQHLAGIVQRRLVDVIDLDSRDIHRGLAWATARMQLLLAADMRDDAAKVADEFLDRFKPDTLLPALEQLRDYLGPKYPLVTRWREAWRRLRARGGGSPPISEIGAQNAQNSPQETARAEPLPLLRGGGKAP